MAKLTNPIDIASLPPARRTLEEEFIRWIGFVPDFSLASFGSFQRFSIPQDASSKSAWVIVTDLGQDGIAVTAGDWAGKADGILRWSTSDETEMSEEALRLKEEALEKAEAEAEMRHDVTALRAEEIYRHGQLPSAPDNAPYFRRKGITNVHGIVKSGWWFDRKALVIPVTDTNGSIQTLQFILNDGSKRFLAGGDKRGNGLLLGAKATAGERKKAFLCEGFATGWSVLRATEMPVLIAFDAGNLKPCAEKWGAFFDLTVVADNDESGTGEEKARGTGLPVILIPSRGMDANDYAAQYGLQELRKVLLPPPSWLVHGDNLRGARQGAEWLIRKNIQKGANIMFFGVSNIGKTFVLLDMLLAMSTGKGDWHGFKAKKAVCAYLCGEGFGGVGKRLDAWLVANGGDTVGSFYVSRGALPLDTREGINEAILELRKLPEKPEVIAIETLSWFNSGDENNARDSGNFLRAINLFREAFGKSLTVIIVTHSGLASEDRARGSTVFKGAMDTEMCLKKDTGKEGFLLLIQTKQKDIEMIDPLRFHLEEVALYPDPDPDADSEMMTSAVVRFDSQISRTDALKAQDKARGEIASDPLAQYAVRIADAWLEHGMETDEDNRPTVTEEQLRKTLRRSYSVDAVKNWFKNDPSRPLAKLVASGRAVREDGHITLIDDTDISAALLRKEKKEDYEKAR